MKVKQFTLATAGSLLLAGAASADFTHIDFDDGTDVTIDGVDYTSYALYAFSDNPAEDVLVAVSGLGETMGMEPGAGGAGFAAWWSNDTNAVGDGGGSGFWNASGFGSRPVFFQPAGAPADWQWDTMWTIGQDNLSTGDEPEAQLAPGTSIDLAGPGPTIMSPGNAGLGSMFITPDNAAGVPDAQGRVLIGRYTVETGEHVSFGANIDFGNFSGRGVGQFYGFATTIPAPGALALLGVAGLAARRRRRA